MRERRPFYMTKFRCIGGDCPDTCCRDWEVVLDEESAAFYRTVPGELGDLLRASMTELDSEPCFYLKDGLCPLLNERGLCRIQLELGEERLSRSCDLHPRFAEEYGSLREWVVSMACPEAARLLLSDPAPVTFVEEQTDEPVSGCNDLDPRLFFSLVSLRKTAYGIVQDRSVDWQTRSARLLSLAEAYQRNLDQHRLARLDGVIQRYAEGRYPQNLSLGTPDWSLLDTLEPINDTWNTLWRQTRDFVPTAEVETAYHQATASWDYQWEHLLMYFLYRYVLKAVNDRQVLPRIRLAVYSVLWLRRMELAQFAHHGWRMETRMDLLHRYSRQVEHSADNLQKLHTILTKTVI